jgi:hypothetical protein
MKNDFTLEKVIDMAKKYASEQFVEVLNDYGYEVEFFEKYGYTIKVFDDE